ncbi:MAG: WcaF family extracellular polysaccharide biosynthesis acetyltransferase [Tepidisphaeraceae bacterium]
MSSGVLPAGRDSSNIPRKMATPLRNQSPYTTGQKIKRLLWGIVQSTLFRWSLHPMYGWRAFLLRAFGAKLGANVRVRRTATFEIPWNITLGDHVSIGDHAIVYALGPVTVGARSFLSQFAHLCAGTHDGTSPDYPLLRMPITIGADCWIAADAFVGPGVTIADGVLVGARSSVFSDLPEWTVCVGNPAKPIKPREFGGRAVAAPPSVT